jgi:hypothetical protein
MLPRRVLSCIAVLSSALAGCDSPDYLLCVQPGVVSHYRGSISWITASEPLPIDSAGAGSPPGACASGAAMAEVLVRDYFPFPSGDVRGCGARFALELQPSFAADCTIAAQPTDEVRDRGRGSGYPLIEIAAVAVIGSRCTLESPAGTLDLTATVGTVSLRPATLELVVAGSATEGPDPRFVSCGAGYARLAFTGNRGPTDPP